jgi:hypothetical protein
MARRRRKTLVVCAACHDAIHGRQSTATTNTELSLESWMIGNDHIRFGRGVVGSRTNSPWHLARRPTSRRPRLAGLIRR